VPELPELEIYRERLAAALAGRSVETARAHSPFVVRTAEPPLADVVGRRVTGVERAGKHLVLGLEGPRLVAFHLMLAGRLHLKRTEDWRPHRKRTLLAIGFDDGTCLEMTEAGTTKRASVHVLARRADLARLDRGIDPFDPALTPARLGELLRARNRQLKGALRAPELLAGIGNAYSDEILFAARLSPLRLTHSLGDEEVERLHATIRDTLRLWIDRVRERCPEGLPVKQDLWRREMAVHGKTGEPCPACGGPVAVISLRDSETNYCPACQNEGRLLADRRLSRLGIRRPPRPRE
jgi:formamidopyrimidine-DNA glycosylase